MIEPRLFLCSGAAEDPALALGRKVVRLDAGGDDPNVHVRLEDVAEVLQDHLDDRLTDLLEIASYVFTADCAMRRSSQWTDSGSEEPWGRDLRLVIPVRDDAFWTRGEVSEQLVRTVGFLSEDHWQFDFQPLERTRMRQGYLQMGGAASWPFYGVERVLMFSGGLDSLAGAVEVLSAGQRLVLVSHRSVTTMDARQKQLFAAVAKRYPGCVQRVPVWVNKSEGLDREPTQRTRSLLFSVLGAVVARSIGARGVRFFENGVVSLNLPVADEVQRARASRTTHPMALAMLSNLLELVFGHPLVLDNPYLYKTKSEVVAILNQHGQTDLIGLSRSCPHGMFVSKSQQHCGTCSQCIDRRVAVTAAGLQDQDPATDYIVDVFRGPRKDGYERNIAINYVRHAQELDTASEAAIAQRFSRDLARAVRDESDRATAAERLIRMHKRHAAAVMDVVREQVRAHADALVDGTLPDSSLLRLVVGKQHLMSSWVRYADKLAQVLAAGLPVACQQVKPKDEPHLQQMCDGLLKGAELDLVREYPFMRWSSVLAKPDWSAGGLQLLVELKYVRKKADIRPITEAIAADITKYGDSGARVLFVVYDPEHLIVDEPAFAAPIHQRSAMLARFVR
ncbi:MAG: hypothetical protein EPO26_14395 [Chloroflexota bacterium]|nr:MAG: hypothetical protein EPO26_14395 [Chloroflexota bacterium]